MSKTVPFLIFLEAVLEISSGNCCEIQVSNVENDKIYFQEQFVNKMLYTMFKQRGQNVRRF